MIALAAMVLGASSCRRKALGARMHRLLLGLIVLITPATLSAQDTGDGVSFRFGLGPSVTPDYFGSDNASWGATGSFALERFQYGGLSFGGEDAQGVGFSGSFRFVSGRDSADYPELAGLATIDPSVEIGGGLTYTIGSLSGFASVRYGVTGHQAFVTEVGADYTFDLLPDVSVSVGPRALWGDEKYMQTYFGVTEAEANNSSFDAFPTAAGLASAGLLVETVYSVNDEWQVVGTIRYDRLQGDAAASPITASDDQISASVAVTRLISFNF